MKLQNSMAKFDFASCCSFFFFFWLAPTILRELSITPSSTCTTSITIGEAKSFFFSCAVHFFLPAPLLRICRAPSLLILGTGPILVIKTVLIPSTRATEEIAPISFPRPLSLEAVIIQSKAILVVEDILVALKSPVAQISISVCPRILDGTESVDIS